MTSAGNRFYNEDVGHADMAEAPRRIPESKSKGFLMGLVVTVVVLVLAVVLIRGSLPAMTPEQIVQQKEYQGQQPPRHIFNLYSLKQDKQRRELETTGTKLEQAAGSEELEQSGSSGTKTEARAVVKPDVTTIYEKADLKREAVLPVVSKLATDVVEAPASDTVTEPLILAVSKPAQAISDLPQTARVVEPTVAKTVQEGRAAVASIASAPLNDLTELPVQTIELNNSRLRSRPAFDAEVIKMLKKGQTITVFAKVGEWTQIATNDGAGTTGYIHNSLLGVGNSGR